MGEQDAALDRSGRALARQPDGLFRLRACPLAFAQLPMRLGELGEHEGFPVERRAAPPDHRERVLEGTRGLLAVLAYRVRAAEGVVCRRQRERAADPFGDLDRLARVVERGLRVAPALGGGEAPLARPPHPPPPPGPPGPARPRARPRAPLPPPPRPQ